MSPLFKILNHRLKIITLIVILGCQILLLINSRFTVWPEMILYPWLMTQGFELYKDIVNPYTPFLSLVLAWYFQVFGTNIINLKIFTYILIILANLLVFWGAYKLSNDSKKGLLASFIYVLLQYSYGGNGLWFELALAPFLTAGLLIIYLDSQNKLKLVIAGILLGMAVLIKQNAILFYFLAVYLLISRKQLKNLVYLVLSGALSLIITVYWLSVQGLLQDFIFWAVVLPLSYSSQPGFVSIPALRQYLLILFPVASLIGLLSLKINIKEKGFWLACFFLAILFAFPRYEDFHLQVLVVFSAIGASFLPRKYLAVFVLISVIIFIRSGTKLWQQEDRFLDQETISLANKIDDYSSVYLLNSPDLVYFLANKLPPKLWAANFPWYFEQPGFEDGFIKNLDQEKTEFIVIGDQIGGGRYSLGNYLPEKLVGFINKGYYQKEKFGKFQIWQRK